MAKFYITTAIPYVNSDPHIGHALEFIQTDCIKRFHETKKEATFLTTGSDDNSLKNVRSAEKEGITPAELCERNAEKFKELAKSLNVVYDVFLKSSASKEHKKGVKKLWNLSNKKGDIYQKKYKGLYCVGCEAFYKPKKLVRGKCPEHKVKPETVSEKNYFFRLKKYQKQLYKLIESDELKIYPVKRKNEALSFIKQGLEDFSISRSKERAHSWGIPVPGDKDQIIYVWYDALSVYITAIGYGSDQKKFKKLWPADIHVIGKGILRFHAVYWPAMLLSAGLPLPKSIFVHGYINFEGQKMSKSLGNVINPFEMIEKYGTEALRYYMLREIPTFEDGNFAQKRLIEVFNNELVANIGNFINRTLRFIDRYTDGIVPEKGDLTESDKRMIDIMEEAVKEIGNDLDNLKLKNGINKILALSAEGNKYFQEERPWESMKTGSKRVYTVLYICANLCEKIGTLLYPYLPESSNKILSQLNVKRGKGKLRVKSGHQIGKPEITFQKFDV